MNRWGHVLLGIHIHIPSTLGPDCAAGQVAFGVATLSSMHPTRLQLHLNVFRGFGLFLFKYIKAIKY